MLRAIILCGGLSTRLGEITKTTPKVLLKIGPKTVLDWQLDKIRELGINEVVLAAGHLSNVLQKQIGNYYRGFKIFYSIENKKLGTGGAIKKALNFVDLKTDQSLIFNGDVLFTGSLKNFVNFNKPELMTGLILGVKVEEAKQYGLLDFSQNGLLINFAEKQDIHNKEDKYINAGIYLFNPQAYDLFPDLDVFSLEYDYFSKVKDFYVYTTQKEWIDIGVPDRLEWARQNYELFNK